MSQDTLFEKNFVRGRFKGLKPSVVVGLWIALVMIGLFLFCSEVLGIWPIIEDDFESYELGALAGQDDWLTEARSFDVVDDDSASGSQSVFGDVWDANTTNSYITGLSRADGDTSYYFKIPSENRVWTNNQDYASVLFREVGTKFQIRIYADDRPDPDEITVKLRQGASPYTEYLIKENVSYDEWHRIEAEWRDDDYKARVKIDDEEFIEWSATGTTWSGVEIVMLLSWITNYYDDISVAVCELETCFACGTYKACIEAGCFWYYSIYGAGLGIKQYYCVEPYDPDPEECGSFFKCQWCDTQETCEAELCVWEDRYGLGEKCYMPEPVIPPEQVEWEVPDLEECGELSGVELWLCEIKNFGAGIFMPSQAKVNSLYQTIGAFKDKFPFNYASSLNRFFDDIGESVDEEKGIPIKILGEEGNVSFAFWDTTTTIGGEEETLKNVWFDFTSVIVLLGWFVWLISIIRRFFK